MVYRFHSPTVSRASNAFFVNGIVLGSPFFVLTMSITGPTIGSRRIMEDFRPNDSDGRRPVAIDQRKNNRKPLSSIKASMAS
uniref:Uncharacterized protein n=1 Tax=uncultured marine virus TaxID=186617 RepID=A0A0F7L5S3_9VIRU|nr:hypothetical protein [uncultured marine virus]